MNSFLNKSIILFLSIILIISFTALVKVKFLGFNTSMLFTKNENFKKKLIEFENFKKERDNINLILGSSFAQSMNARQLGKIGLIFQIHIKTSITAIDFLKIIQKQ